MRKMKSEKEAGFGNYNFDCPQHKNTGFPGEACFHNNPNKFKVGQTVYNKHGRKGKVVDLQLTKSWFNSDTRFRIKWQDGEYENSHCGHLSKKNPKEPHDKKE